MNSIARLLLVFGLIVSTSPVVAPDNPPKTADFTTIRYTADFVSAHDGDTFLIDRRDPIKIRLQGIDAPELTTNSHGPADPVAAKASRDYLVGLLAGKTVFVEETAESFDRKVAKVWVADINGRLIDVGWLMTSAGMAKVYRP